MESNLAGLSDRNCQVRSWWAISPRPIKSVVKGLSLPQASLVHGFCASGLTHLWNASILDPSGETALDYQRERGWGREKRVKWGINGDGRRLDLGC